MPRFSSRPAYILKILLPCVRGVCRFISFESFYRGPVRTFPPTSARPIIGLRAVGNPSIPATPQFVLFNYCKSARYGRNDVRISASPATITIILQVFLCLLNVSIISYLVYGISYLVSRGYYFYKFSFSNL